MAEGARLESVYTATYRGFESLPHRHILRRARTQVRAFFSHIAPRRGDEKPRPGFDNWRQPVGQMTSLRGICPDKIAGSNFEQRLRWPRRGEQSESIPPSPPSFKKSSYESTGFFSHVAHLRGDEKPRPVMYWRQTTKPGFPGLEDGVHISCKR